MPLSEAASGRGEKFVSPALREANFVLALLQIVSGPAGERIRASFTFVSNALALFALFPVKENEERFGIFSILYAEVSFLLSTLL